MTARPARIACAAALVLAACRGADPSAPAGRDWPSEELRTGGRPVAAALGPKEVHRYRLPLQKGFLLRLVVDQQGIDAAVFLEDPAGQRVLKADRAINDLGLELVLAVAEREGAYTLVLQGPKDGTKPGRYEARVEALRPASPADRRSASAYRLFTRGNDLASKEPEKALALWTQALAIWRELGEAALEAEACERIARYYHSVRKPQLAVDWYRTAAAGFKRIRSPRWEAIARNGMGADLLSQAKALEAEEQYALALPLATRVVDPLARAEAIHGLGQAFQNQGELQRPLDHYNQALKLWPLNHPSRVHTLHQLGLVYYYLRDEERGREKLLQALKAWTPESGWKRARTLSQLGRLSLENDRLDEARQFYQEALPLQQKEDPCGSAVVLAQLALVEEAQGAHPKADARQEDALRIVRSQSCPRSEPTVYLLAARLAETRGDHARGLSEYRHSEKLFKKLGDRLGVAESLTGFARNARVLGKRQEARDANRRALDILEGVRPTVLSEDLRISFFSGARAAFDLQIDLLMELGAEEEAWITAEEARNRSLQDLLAEAGTGLRKDAAPALVARERTLQRELNALEAQRLATSDSKQEKLQALRKAVDNKVAELESLRGEIRRQSRGGTFLGQSEPVSLAAARRELLDSDTVLLEYRLGKTASTVWAVTRDRLAAFRLPRPRSEIERDVRKAVRRLGSLEGHRFDRQALCDLGHLLLGPVEPFLRYRRVVVVADGALEALPFAALPLPSRDKNCQEVPVLVEDHEVVSLPSVATLLTQRRVLAGRPPAPGWLAVVADPAYDPAPASGRARRRLPASKKEAEAIVDGLPADKVLVATGAAASREIVKGGALRGFRILHVATHGDLSPEQPLLSSLALAELDAGGQRVPQGTLPAHEIYGLDLPAELVVLSACETALGREVPGEGLVSGLPRAFLYAGAARVLVSLWKVDDQRTRDLMVLFYQGLFDRKLPPDRALAEAQRSLLR